MKTKVILIFILAFILRFWQLGTNPPSLDWDEAALGYNAYSILQTGKDEYGAFLPLSFRSFGDYKPPLYTYLAIIPIKLFGLNEFSVRFISALFGTLTTVVVYFLVKKLFPHKSFILYLLSFLFISISPWHIQFSRVAFEANLALFFFIFAIYLCFIALEKGKFFIPAAVSFALSMYAYHSPRLLVPLIIFCFVVIYRKNIKTQIIPAVISFVLFIILVLPIFIDLSSATSARLNSVTLFNPNERLGESINEMTVDAQKGDKIGQLTHNRRIVYAKEVIGGYLDHFSFDFLFLNGDPPGRHHAAGMGMLYLWDLPFIIIGLFYLLGHRDKNVLFLFSWFLIAPIASSITTGTPHAVRAIFYIPVYQIFSAIGFTVFICFLKSKNIIFSKTIIAFSAFLLIFNFYYYLNLYYIVTPVEFSQWWQYGYKQVVSKVSKLENKYDKVIVTYQYDQPYIFFLFYQKIDPWAYQKESNQAPIERSDRSFGKYEFHHINWPKDSQYPKTLIIGAPGEIPENIPSIDEIQFLDGTKAFKIVGT